MHVLYIIFKSNIQYIKKKIYCNTLTDMKRIVSFLFEAGGVGVKVKRHSHMQMTAVLTDTKSIFYFLFVGDGVCMRAKSHSHTQMTALTDTKSIVSVLFEGDGVGVGVDVRYG